MEPKIVREQRAPNTPFVSQVGRETRQKLTKEVKEEPQAQPLLKLEAYAPPPKPVSKNLALWTTPTTALTSGETLQVPVQNVYNITLPGPTGSHVSMDKIYENVLPGKENILTFTTLGERLQIYDYVRQILVRREEGETINLGPQDSKAQQSLLSYLKFLELNPNFYSPIEKNPYRGLPHGLLIYRSCFPIMFEERSQSVICSGNSIGLNIRLYALSFAEYFSYRYKMPIYREYDVWRELAYYEFLREKILKPRRSPHFPILYAFFFCSNSTIDFYRLKKFCFTQKDYLTKEYQRFLEFIRLRTQKVLPPIMEFKIPMRMAESTVAKLPDEMDPLLQSYSGNLLILVTEAPTQNIYQWASRIYERHGVVRRMVHHGFHNEDEWLNIFFQITAAFCVLQLQGIYLRQMTLRDNVYVRDLGTQKNVTSYWKYIIDGITYYLPNRGYMVLIDSNFKDIEQPGETFGQIREHKIYLREMFDHPKLDDYIVQNYRQMVNTNSFTKEHTQNNVTRPPESILKRLEAIMMDPETDLRRIMLKHFQMFLNNRIGTLLKHDTEVPNIREISRPFHRGEMAVEVVESDLYRWCLVTQIKENGLIEILSAEKPNKMDYYFRDVRIETLRQYSAYEKIEQDFVDINLNFSEEQLLETYVVGDRKSVV